MQRNDQSNKQSSGQKESSPLNKGMVGFVLSHEQFAVPELVELGAASSEVGFDAVWDSDHFQPWQDNQGHAGFAWVTLAAVSQRAKGIVAGTGVTCPTYRYNPAIVAQAFASLSLLYPGKLFLGVGTGEALNEQPSGGGWGDYDERAERLVEAIGLIRRLWTGEIVDHVGKYYTVEDAKLYDVPSPLVPIYIAASGEHSLSLAGEHGDGLITDSKTLLDPELRAAFERGARKAGKDPRTMPIIVEHWMVVGDEEEAKGVAPLWRFIPKAWEKYVDIPDPREIQRQAEQEVRLEEVYKDWVVSTDPQTHVDGLQKLFDNGATLVMVHSAQPDQKAVIDFWGKEVLPKLRQQRAIAY